MALAAQATTYGDEEASSAGDEMRYNTYAMDDMDQGEEGKRRNSSVY